ncbi:autophagy-related protein 13b-like isoform X1 [Selaginella moellendorffii]|uniref:autophagy-related protein 13b-like isoform X1 n=1 Tax=Selaginella moellendorffii TaxID=88036 RepID=UPI000D1D0915|nr:autophagy-related protein 13b-like isoform X1 [Selaginella moellendorffii]|eukprot:XP_024520258.1 autophagy-related protein 13b-like isoform X1 [Selaginella moellendorffii]
MAGSLSMSKTEQIIVEFFVKCLHIILEARIPCSSSNSSSQPGRDSPSPASSSSSKDRWFNLVLGDCPAALESAEPWRRGPGDHPPMVVDILLDRSSGDHRFRGGGGPGTPDSWSEGEVEDSYGTVLERWTISHERFSQRRSGSSSSHALEVPGIYKRATILMRTLYCSVRTLPAHRLFHLATSSSQSRSFSLGFKVWASPPPLLPDEAAMEVRGFAPVETPMGRLAVSVAYRHTTAVTALEVTPAILPRIIADYVGSPTTDPLRRLSADSFTGSVPCGGISGRRGVHVVSVPTSVPSPPSGIGRRHSWGGGLNKLQSPTLLPPSSPSFGSSPSSRQHSPVAPPTTRTNHSQPIPIYEQQQQRSRLSPPNPSPPGTCHSLESSLARYLPRHSTAPVSIPKPSSVRGLHDRSALPPPTPRRSFEQPPQHVYASSNLSGARGDVPPRLSASTLAESMLLISPPHPYQSSQGDEGPPSGVKRSLYGSPRVSLSRSSSKLRDDTDDEEFACPFAVDEDDEELQSRSPRTRHTNVFEASGPKSQHAAVGALVRLLKSAPPLQGRSWSLAGGEVDMAAVASPEATHQVVRSKSRPIPGAVQQHRYQASVAAYQAPHHVYRQQQMTKSLKTTSEALEELEVYKDLRKFILTEQGSVQASRQ